MLKIIATIKKQIFTINRLNYISSILEMNKPKILFILHLPPPVHGAAIAGTYLKQSKVINEEFEADYISLATNTTLKQSGKFGFKKISTFSRLISEVLSALKKKKYDLCYMTLTSHGSAFYKDTFIVSLLKMKNNKIIYHFHNKGVSISKSKFSQSLYKYVFKNTKSILLSSYLYPDVQRYVENKDVFYCPNGIPENTLFNDEKKPLQENEADSVCQLLFLSNMMREKGIFVLLDACEQLKKKGLLFECHFVGGWSNITEEEFESATKSKGISDVAFAHGPKYNEEKMAFYKKADVFVFPTFYDVFPLVALEAMQNKLPIVSSPEGGIPDIVIEGKTGFLVPHDNATILTEKLTILIRNPELRLQMGAEGRETIRRAFYTKKMGNEYVRYFKRNHLPKRNRILFICGAMNV